MDKRHIILLTCMVAHLFTAMLYSMQAPFLPVEGSLKGLTPTQFSLPFAVFEFTGLVVSPFSSIFIRDIGSKYTACLFLILSGSASIIFGFLNYIEDGNKFLILACCLRVCEATGTLTYMVTAFAIINTIYSENPQAKASILLTAFFVGMSLGPVLGGLLYSIGGFFLPFVTIAPVVLIASCILMYVLPNQMESGSQEDGAAPSMMKLLSVPGIWVGMLSVGVSALCQGYLQTTLEPHFRYFHLAASTVSLLFAISPGMNFIGSSVNTFLMDKGANTRVLMMAGNVINIVSFSFLGPIPIGEDPHPVFWMAILGLFINGLAAAVMYTAGFADPIQVAHYHGFPSDEATNGVISSATMMAVTTGAFVGPLMGGYLFQHLGMHYGVLVVIGANALSLVFMYLLILWDRRHLKRISPEERQPLIKPKEVRRRRLTTSISRPTIL